MRQDSRRLGCGGRRCPRCSERGDEAVDRELLELVDGAVEHGVIVVEADALGRDREAPPVGLEHGLDLGPALRGRAGRLRVRSLEVHAERMRPQRHQGHAVGVRDARMTGGCARPAVRAAAARADGGDVVGAELAQQGAARRARAGGEVGGPGDADAVPPLIRSPCGAQYSPLTTK